MNYACKKCFKNYVWKIVKIIFKSEINIHKQILESAKEKRREERERDKEREILKVGRNFLNFFYIKNSVKLIIMRSIF